MPVHESGYARLVANFENLYIHCSEYGAAYNPGYPALQLATLHTRLGSARAAMANVQLTKTAWTNATNQRVVLFNEVRKRATRIISALVACGASPERIGNAKSISRKLNGRRIGALPTAETTARDTSTTVIGTTPAPAPGAGASEGPSRHSVSQQSYDFIIEYFAALVTLVASEPLYTPIEADLQLPALNGFVEQLRNTCSLVITTRTQYENARQVRNNELYNTVSGISTLGQQIKIISNHFLVLPANSISRSGQSMFPEYFLSNS